MTSHAEWLQNQLDYQMSDFGKEVANIIGFAWAGIYHLNTSSYLHERTKWNSPDFIQIVVFGELATWDSNHLTELVVLCHDTCIRLAIVAKGPNYLELSFSKRSRNPGESPIAQGHPSIEEQIAKIRGGA